jgi:hypothetical protein
MTSDLKRDETVLCWQCANEQSNPIHDPDAHDDCPWWCTHHSFEVEPESRNALLGHVAALVEERERWRREAEEQRKRADDFERKGMSLCNWVGNLMLISHRLQTAVALSPVTGEVARLIEEIDALLGIRAKESEPAFQLVERIATLEGQLAKVRDAVPTTWLDPILTGPTAVFRADRSAAANVQDVLVAVKARIVALAPSEAAGNDGTTFPLTSPPR